MPCGGWQVRILKEKETGANKGYAFVTFTNRQDAEKAIATLGECEIKVRRGKGMVSHMSVHGIYAQECVHAVYVGMMYSVSYINHKYICNHYMCTCVCMHACLYVYLGTSMYVCMYVCVNVYM